MSVYFRMSLDDIPKKTQYVIIDSNFVDGTNNTFSLDLRLESNTHVEDMSRVLGIKMVDFYITQVGGNDGTDTDIAKFVDIICPEVPKVAQILDERHGQIFARVPLRETSSLEVLESRTTRQTMRKDFDRTHKLLSIQFQLRS
jgi:hypothetical protein